MDKKMKQKITDTRAIGYAIGVLEGVIHFLDVQEEQKKAIEEAIRGLEEIIKRLEEVNIS